jgi:uncharacterized sulfatase
MQQKKDKPFINIFLTLGIHGPYDHKPLDMSMASFIKEKNIKSKIPREDVKGSILLTDDAIENYFSQIKDQPAFNNTIFIITGDHNIGPGLPLKSPIEIYRVPLIIYSPLLKETKQFSSIVSHRDILPSLLGLLSEKYNVTLKENMSLTGVQLDTSSFFQSKTSTDLVLYSKKLPTYIEGMHYLCENEVYQITDSLMNSKKINNDSIKNILIDRVKEKRVLNQYVIRKNKLIP